KRARGEFGLGKILEKLVQKLGVIDEAMDEQSFAPLMIGLPAMAGLGEGGAFQAFAGPRHEIMRHGPAAGLAAGLGDRPGDAAERLRSGNETAHLRAGRGQVLGKAALEVLSVVFSHRVVADLRDEGRQLLIQAAEIFSTKIIYG
ncbi:MAG: hypothetical protein ACK4UV_03865, partial [Ignavibacterium sp.]